MFILVTSVTLGPKMCLVIGHLIFKAGGLPSCLPPILAGPTDSGYWILPVSFGLFYVVAVTVSLFSNLCAIHLGDYQTVVDWKSDIIIIVVQFMANSKSDDKIGVQLTTVSIKN